MKIKLYKICINIFKEHLKKAEYGNGNRGGSLPSHLSSTLSSANKKHKK